MRISRVCILAFLLGSTAAFAQSNPPPDYRQPICLVYKAAHDALLRVEHTPRSEAELRLVKGNPNGKLYSRRELAVALARIDLSACPDDFKAAWKAYVVSLTLSSKVSAKDLGEAILHPVTGLPAVVLEAKGQADETANARRNAALQLELSTSSYGVTNWVKQLHN